MGRVAYRIHKSFDWPLGRPWWGFVLPAIPCRLCNGVDPAAGYCPSCEGEHEVHPKVKVPGWVASEIPAWVDRSDYGAEFGWQMWETCSEGSPISPVLDSPQELAKWLADNGASAFADMTQTEEQWLSAIVGGGFMGMLIDTATGERRPA